MYPSLVCFASAPGPGATAARRKRPRLRGRQLLWVDLAGALASALLLGVVLPEWQTVFGIPRTVLYPLAALAVVFAFIDGVSLRRSAAGQWAGLRTIAVLNAAYAGLSLVLAFQHRAALTELGVAYLILEVLIVGSLALLEWRVARRPSDPQP